MSLARPQSRMCYTSVAPSRMGRAGTSHVAKRAGSTALDCALNDGSKAHCSDTRTTDNVHLQQFRAGRFASAVNKILDRAPPSYA